MSCTDLAVSFPARGVIRLSSHALFGDTDGPTCRRFIEQVFQAEEISDVTITAGDSPHEEGLAKLCELRDIARDLDHNVKRSWSMILAPNIACIAGVFTMGFGIMASVVTNNVAALAALGNGVLPLRKVAQIEAERRHRLEMTQTHAMERNPVHSTAASADRRADADRDRQRVLAASA